MKTGHGDNYTCHQCGYDLESTLRAAVTTCPECGADVAHMVYIDESGKRPPVLIPRTNPPPVSWKSYAMLSLLPGLGLILAALLGYYVLKVLGLIGGVLALLGALLCMLAIVKRTKPLQRSLGARCGVFVAILPCACSTGIWTLIWLAAMY